MNCLIPVDVEFIWKGDDDTNEVLLCGSWSDWKVFQRMKRIDKNHFVASCELCPGDYEFKYIVDGEWCTDPSIEIGDSEYRNNVIRVSEPIRLSMQQVGCHDPFTMVIDLSVPLESIIEQIKEHFQLEGTYTLMQTDGTLITKADDITKGDHLILKRIPDEDSNHEQAGGGEKKVLEGKFDRESPLHLSQTSRNYPDARVVLICTNDSEIPPKVFPCLESAIKWLREHNADGTKTFSVEGPSLGLLHRLQVPVEQQQTKGQKVGEKPHVHERYMPEHIYINFSS